MTVRGRGAVRRVSKGEHPGERQGHQQCGQDPGRHCCIKAKGVLATHQSGEAGPSGTLENRNNRASGDLLRGF